MALDADPDDEPRVIARIDTPSLPGVVRLIAIIAACAGALYVLYLTRGVVKLLVIAVFTAVALAPAGDAVQKAKLPRAWSILIVYLAAAIAIAGIAALMVPSVASQVGRLSHDATHGVSDLRRNATFRHFDDRYHVSAKVNEQLKQLPSHAE